MNAINHQPSASSVHRPWTCHANYFMKSIQNAKFFSRKFLPMKVQKKFLGHFVPTLYIERNDETNVKKTINIDIETFSISPNKNIS